LVASSIQAAVNHLFSEHDEEQFASVGNKDMEWTSRKVAELEIYEGDNQF
jgi:hypothetical protein